MYNPNDIRQTYGQNSLNMIRKFEALSKQHGRHSSHLHFNMQMKHTNLIPKSLKIKAQTDSREAKAIITKAEKALLNIRIKESIKNKHSIQTQKLAIQEKIKTTFPDQIYQQIIEIGNKREYSELQKSRSKQKNKYYTIRYGRNLEKQTSNRGTNNSHTNTLKGTRLTKNTNRNGYKTYPNEH